MPPLKGGQESNPKRDLKGHSHLIGTVSIANAISLRERISQMQSFDNVFL